MPKPTTKEILVEAFIAALAAAKDADPGQAADGGTSNLDSVAIFVPNVRKSTIDSAADFASTYATKFHWLGSTAYWVDVGAMGQGSRNTAMVEAGAQAMQKVFDKHGMTTWRAMVYYRMD